MPFLYRIHTDGSASSRHRVRDKPLIWDRSRSAGVTISENVALSHEHFALIPAAGGIFIRDLDSTNGTWVNGERVRKRLLLPHDRLLAGSLALRARARPCDDDDRNDENATIMRFPA